MKSFATVFLVSFALFYASASAWNFPTWNGRAADQIPPHWNIDGIFYDNIANNLSAGRGFVVDFEDSQWRQKYQLDSQSLDAEALYEWVFQFEGVGPTAMRSPGYPFVLSWIYRTFGWRLDTARLLGMVMSCLGLAMIVSWSYEKWGLIVSCIAAITLMVDYSVMQTSGMIASEPLAILAFSIAFTRLAALIEKPSVPRSLILGLAFAGLFLTRGNWNLGLLLVLFCFPLLAMAKVRDRIEPIKIQHIAIVLFTALLVALPWWIRNCQVTGQFQPFGTAGASGLVAAYCDESLADYGNWKSAVFHRNQKSVFREIDLSKVPLAKREYLVGRSSTTIATKWAIANWYQLPKLAIFRYLSHWGLFNSAVPTPFQIANAVWLIFGLAGCLFLSGRQKKLLAFVLLIDAIIVMLTWAHLGRYGIPVRSLLHIGCALTIVRFWQYLIFDRQAALEAIRK